jgi:hypothetical protein
MPNSIENDVYNCLIAKDSVGKSKPPSYKLPPEDFVYGSKLAHTPELTTAEGQAYNDYH